MEVAGSAATLYLVRQITVASRAALLAACQALPAAVKVLCVSVQDSWQLGSGSLTVMGELKRYWMATRPTGAFRLGGSLSFDENEDRNRTATSEPPLAVAGSR